MKTNIGNLEEEKTLPMVIKNLQTDADLNQPLNKQDHNVNCWEKVTESQKRGEALTVTKGLFTWGEVIPVSEKTFRLTK